MKLLIIIHILFISLQLKAQLMSSEITELSNDLVGILPMTNQASDGFNLDIVKASSELESNLYSNKSPLDECLIEMNRCEQFKSNLLPPKAKEKDFRVLFEIKYQPIFESRYSDSGRGLTNLDSSFLYIEMFMDNHLPGNIENFNQLQSFAQNHLESQNWPSHPYQFEEKLTSALLIKELQKTTSYDEMMQKFKMLSSDMNQAQRLNFLSTLAGYIPYNTSRAMMVQEEGAALGNLGAFDLLKSTNGGICGDIHSAIAKFAEQWGMEAVTIGYATTGGQHVVTGVTNKETGDFTLINYADYQTSELNDDNSFALSASELGTEDVGIQYRIFKNKAEGKDQAMRNIANIPTSLGSFMNDLFKKQHHLSAAMPENRNYTKEAVRLEYNQNKVKEKKSGKIVEKELTDGLIVYQGEVENAEVFGVAVSHDVFKELYAYDPVTGKCEKKKSKYFAAGLAASLANFDKNPNLDTYYVYLNIKGGKIHHIYQSDYFKFSGMIGYDFSGFASMNEGDIESVSGDANLRTFAGVSLDYAKKNTKLKFALSSDYFLGLNDQTGYTDISQLDKNINPLMFNAASVDLKGEQKLSPKLSLLTDNNLTVSKVGGRVLFSTGVLVGKTSLMVTHQNTTGALKLGPHLSEMNLLPTMNGRPSGTYVDIYTNFQNRKNTIGGRLGGYGGVANDLSPFVGGTLQLQLKTKRKSK